MDEVEKLVEAAVLLISHLVQGTKLLTIIVRQKRIKQLILFVDGPDFAKSDPHKQEILNKTIKTATFVGQALISSAAVTVIFWCIVPTLKSEMNLPLKTAYPFNYDAQPLFSIMYIYSCISVGLVGVGDAAENYLVSGLIVIAAVQLDVLYEELQEIGSDEKNTYEKTVKCIKYHQHIIQYVDELESIFGFPIFCQFVCSSVVVCMTVFSITITTEVIEFTTLVFYLLCVLMELLMYCFPGELLISKSVLVSEAAYPDYWEGDLKSRRALLLTALRAQRALAVDAGGVFRVGLPTAASIVQTSYSYYAMLRQTTTHNDIANI